MFTAERDIQVMSGRDCLCSLEVRYTFNIVKGRAARTWANAADGFHPAEDATVDLVAVETRFHPSQPWRKADDQADAMLTADVPDSWFIEQAMEQADA